MPMDCAVHAEQFGMAEVLCCCGGSSVGAGGSHAVAGWDLGHFALPGMPGRWIRDGVW